jgi:hypothetical protein
LFTAGYLYDDATGDYLRVEPPSSYRGGAVVLTDQGIVSVGGLRLAPGEQAPGRVRRLELTSEAWILPLE